MEKTLRYVCSEDIRLSRHARGNISGIRLSQHELSINVPQWLREGNGNWKLHAELGTKLREHLSESSAVSVGGGRLGEIMGARQLGGGPRGIITEILHSSENFSVLYEKRRGG